MYFSFSCDRCNSGRNCDCDTNYKLCSCYDYDSSHYYTSCNNCYFCSNYSNSNFDNCCKKSNSSLNNYYNKQYNSPNNSRCYKSCNGRIYPESYNYKYCNCCTHGASCKYCPYCNRPVF